MSPSVKCLQYIAGYATALLPSSTIFLPFPLSHNATIYAKCSTQFDMTKELSTCHHCAHYYCLRGAMRAPHAIVLSTRDTHEHTHTYTHTHMHTLPKHAHTSAWHCIQQRVGSTPTIGMHKLNGFFTLLYPSCRMRGTTALWAWQ